ncbi:hypothetical protein DPMN_075032 [Dreissena polymorpha]|uniref:Uncharacterized protein n=1 Tax=Dreissena polymorpha TaxID=45954 RepID=A0A9D4BEJ6_DREPO|nr:hypothetical protein DPMN_075032 [Dreissena polymorpha]
MCVLSIRLIIISIWKYGNLYALIARTSSKATGHIRYMPHEELVQPTFLPGTTKSQTLS